MTVARLFVLDALGLAYRAHYAFIRRPLVNSRGEITSAMVGFANTALRIRRAEKPDYWALAWDGPGPTERHERYPGYKAHRKPMPEELFAQLPVIEELAQALGLPVLERSGLEADDVMATLARRGAEDGLEVALVTSDKDLVPLVGDRVRLLSPVARGDDYVWVDAERVRSTWGVEPAQVRDVLALMGDSTDNIPGVPGVGEKTAVELISKFGSFDALYERLDEVPRDGLRARLREHRDQAFLSRELVTVRTDCELDITWDDLKLAPMRRDALLSVAKRYELARLERVALEQGVSDLEAGPVVRARDPVRRGGATRRATPSGGLADGESEPRSVVQPMPTAPAAPSAPVETAPPRAAPPAFEPATPPPAPASPPPAPPAQTAPAQETVRTAAMPLELLPELPPAPAPPLETPSAPPESSTAPAEFPTAPVPPGSASQGTLDLFAGADGLDQNLDERIERLHEVRARALHGVALLPVLDGDDPRSSPLVGLALGARDGTVAYVPIGHTMGPNLAFARVREWLAPMLGDPSTPKVGMDLKSDRHALAAAGLDLDGLAFDVHIASFLCDPVRDHRLEALARDVLGLALPQIGDAASPRSRLRPAQLEVRDVAEIAERGVAALFPIADALRAQLESREQWALYERLEHPLIGVLFGMEHAGIRLDRSVLEEQSLRAAGEIARLEAELTGLAGESLNLNSGPQLARVLFEKLKLKPGRRTKTGFSTDQAVLEELASEHPFPARLLEYRALTKLKSTYFDALPVEVDARDGRIHTTFEQTGAATGRLSSSRPNLQNIPMRSPQGREIRRAFVAAPDCHLVGGDYSQIELRVMAHLSGDANLIEAFERREDVHAGTARRVFGVPEGPLDPALRARAKVVNFGIMYGMGARSLSQQMGIGLAEAQQFIRHYFEVYSGVREFLDRSLAEARQRGYVVTLFGRRRYLSDLASTDGGLRSLAERAAINAPIQGSAADLVKLAMVRVDAALKRSVPSARLLLQVHDELLVEAPEADAEAAASTMRVEMERCFPLRVPLEVSVGHGRNWLDAH